MKIHAAWIKTVAASLCLRRAGFSYAVAEYFAGLSFGTLRHEPRLMPRPSSSVARCLRYPQKKFVSSKLQ